MYLGSAIMHGPFVPFSILFTRAVQLLDAPDLARIDRFAASLQPDVDPTESITHPYRLFELLCRGARLYFDLNAPPPPADPTLTRNLPDSLGEFDVAHYQMDPCSRDNEALEAFEGQSYGLSDWYYGNQQMMSLLDEDVMF